MKKLIFGMGAALALTSCEPIVRDVSPHYIQDPVAFTGRAIDGAAQFATADVDYDNKKVMIFFNFKTGKTTAMQHDSWDIAIVTDKKKGADGRIEDDMYVVSNSGDYGESARFLQLDSAEPEKCIGRRAADIRQFSFIDETEDVPDGQKTKEMHNPLRNALTNGKSYVLCTQTRTAGAEEAEARVFLIRFEKTAEPLAAGTPFTLHVTPAVFSAETGKIIRFGEPYTLAETIDGNYSFNYIKFGDSSADFLPSRPNGGGIPKKNEWQLLFTRTSIYSKEMGDVFGTDGIVGASSILTNSPAGVETAALYGWDFPDVTRVPQSNHFALRLDGIGKGFTNPLKDDKEKKRKAWYYGVNMPPTFYLNRITYVFQWKDSGAENYAKFRAGSFYGPQGQKFYVRFRYAYRDGE